MNELFWIIFGIVFAIIVLLIAYPCQVYIKMKVNKKKIKSTLIQIRGQVEFKHNLLKEYIEINKDSIEDDKYNMVVNKLGSYDCNNECNIDALKDFNESFNYHLKSFNDGLLNKQCEESELKISYIKDYYNELVCYFNKYKSNGVNYFVAKAMCIEDEKLY